MPSNDDSSVRKFKFKEPSSDLFVTLNSFRKEEQFCDIVVRVGVKQFYAHKVVLAASSVYFKVYFSSEFSEAKNPEVVLDSIDADVMEVIIDFAYSNLIEITTSNILAVMHAANFLQVESLVVGCCNFLEENLCAEVCFGVWNLLNLCTDRFRNLAKQAQEFIIANFSSVSETQEFLEIEADALVDLIKSNKLNIDSEDVVFDAITRWLCFKRERISVLEKVLCHVRLAYVNPTVLQDWVEGIDLFSLPVCLKLIEEARKYHLLHPSRRADVLSTIKMRRFSARQQEALVIQNRDGEEKSLICVSSNGDIVKHISYPPESEKPRIIVVSSYNNVILAGCWEGIIQYDFETDAWLPITLNKKPRYFYGLCEVDGSWYSVGGEIVGGRVSDVLERYDPVTKTWKQFTSLPTAVSYPAVVSHKGQLFVIGGCLSERRGSDMVQRYDPRRRTWTKLACMPVALHFPSACLLDGIIYVFNFSRDPLEGRRVVAYNPTTDKWRQCRDIPHAFLGGPAVMEGNIYVLADHKGNNSSIMRYSPSEDCWVPFGALEDLKSKLMCGPIIL